METSVSDTPVQGDGGDVRLDMEDSTPHTQANDEMGADSAGERDVFLAVNEASSSAERNEEIRYDTPGGEDGNRRVQTDSSSQAEPSKKVDYVLVYERCQEKEDQDEETKEKAGIHEQIRETFERKLVDAGLEIIERIDAEPSPVSWSVFSADSVFFSVSTPIFRLFYCHLVHMH